MHNTVVREPLKLICQFLFVAFLLLDHLHHHGSTSHTVIYHRGRFFRLEVFHRGQLLKAADLEKYVLLCILQRLRKYGK